MKVVAGEQVVAEHERLNDERRPQFDWQHHVPLLQRKPGALRNGAPFADLPAPLQQRRQTLVRECGGDRVMAQALAILPTAWLDAVLVAVSLALEGALSNQPRTTEELDEPEPDRCAPALSMLGKGRARQ